MPRIAVSGGNEDVVDALVSPIRKTGQAWDDATTPGRPAAAETWSTPTKDAQTPDKDRAPEWAAHKGALARAGAVSEIAAPSPTREARRARRRARGSVESALQLLQTREPTKLEEAVALLETALQFYTREAFPEAWSRTTYNLAVCLSLLGRTRQAIDLFESVLQVQTLTAAPEKWARTKINLGACYETVEPDKAGAQYQAALQVITRDAFPDKWVACATSLADYYRLRRSNTDRAVELYEELREHLDSDTEPWGRVTRHLAMLVGGERAIQLLGESLLVFTSKETHPVDWAATVSSLAVAYERRRQGDPATNRATAAELTRGALLVYTRSEYPEKWARAVVTLASLLPQEDRQAKIQLLQEALQVYTREALPDKYAETKVLLAGLFAKPEMRHEMYEQALQIFSEERTPGRWAKTTAALASSLAASGNLDRAIFQYKQAVRVYAAARGSKPLQWASVARNLASCYAQKPETHGLARGLFAQVLEVFSREAHRVEWVRTQRLLAQAVDRDEAVELFQQALAALNEETQTDEWLETLRGLAAVESDERAIELYSRALQRTGDAKTAYNLALLLGKTPEGVERSIELFHRALQTFTKDDPDPSLWVQATMNLAVAYRERLEGDPDANNARSIELYESCLAGAPLLKTTHPELWAQTMSNLAVSYSDGDDRSRSVELKEQALEVFTREAHPEHWATTTCNLAASLDVDDPRAAELYESTLDLFRDAGHLQCYAVTLCNLAACCQSRDALRAQALLREALDIFKRQRMYHHVGTTKVSLAALLGPGSSDAVQLYEEALEVFKDNAPYWATTAVALAKLQASDDQEKAIALFEAALQAAPTYPAFVSSTSVALSALYRGRAEGDRAANMERAIQLLSAAREWYASSADSEQWKQATKALAACYQSRVAGDKQANALRAVELLQSAEEDQ